MTEVLEEYKVEEKESEDVAKSKSTPKPTATKTLVQEPDIEVIISDSRVGLKKVIPLKSTGRHVEIWNQIGKGDLVTAEEAEELVGLQYPVCCQKENKWFFVTPFKVVI